MASSMCLVLSVLLDDSNHGVHTRFELARIFSDYRISCAWQEVACCDFECYGFDPDSEEVREANARWSQVRTRWSDLVKAHLVLVVREWHSNPTQPVEVEEYVRSKIAWDNLVLAGITEYELFEAIQDAQYQCYGMVRVR